ncbi:M55 family metallopeptidase [Microtetraspora sp. NBRC 13810]|uniref:M55 family metallopeptidase n=1 Tax=Microtetraspora sp. NBRC 13810 TaxID=3030990 RepID=UPI0025569ADA|nr:M55 family metallopeptidase [Microtetraspora sp. NBRC 13810]
MGIKALVSVDMEGIAGVVHPAEINPERYEYDRCRRLMTGAANAAVEGIIDADPAAEVLVADSHGPYRNILPEDLDRRARLVRGKPRQLGMLAGLQGGVEVALFVGYHGRAGAGGAVLAHTISDAVLDIRIHGRSHGEIGINTLLAGSYGVPVVLVSGDDAACEEFADLAPGAVTVPVKRGLGQHAADTLHPEEARDRLREGTARAIRRRTGEPPVSVPQPVEVEVDLHQPRGADLAVLIPGVSRKGGRTLTFTAQTMTAAYEVIQLIVLLAQTPS